jgi:hypothetical protein
VTAPTACGHQWASAPGAHEHSCHRVSPNHRSHECGCSEVILRTLPYQPAGTIRPEASGATTVGGY